VTGSEYDWMPTSRNELCTYLTHNVPLHLYIPTFHSLIYFLPFTKMILSFFYDFFIHVPVIMAKSRSKLYTGRFKMKDQYF